MLRGSRDSLRGHLLRQYRDEYRKPPGATAVSDCLAQLEAEASILEPEPVHQRVGETADGRVVIDLGDATGRAVVVGPQGWRITKGGELLFRRTKLTSPLPVPQRGGTAADLREFLNVSDATWPLALGWIVAALVPDIAHPLLSLGGEQGTGKSTAAQILVQLFDPSPAPLRSRPRDERQWVISAAGSWGVVVDNVSKIPEWWSDALCKSSTGDGWVDRKLYSDMDLAVLAFRRVVILTSIDPGALRGDLGDRLVMLDLEEITPTARKSEKKLLHRYEAARPSILGAILDLLAGVLARLPSLHLPEMHRMADFCRVLGALDLVTGLRCLPAFLGQRKRIADQVVSSDPVASAIRDLLERQPAWIGTSTKLLEKLTPGRSSRGWPNTPSAMAGHLTRLAPALREVGIKINRKRAPGGNRDRNIHLFRVAVGTDGAGDGAGDGANDRPECPDRPANASRDTRDTSVQDSCTAEQNTPHEGGRTSACNGESFRTYDEGDHA